MEEVSVGFMKEELLKKGFARIISSENIIKATVFDDSTIEIRNMTTNEVMPHYIDM